MGRSYTPKYALHFETTMRGHFTPIAWDVRNNYGPGKGRPTTENIDRWVKGFEDSCMPGGCNAHLGIFSITRAKIINQFTKEVVAEWVRNVARRNEPMFQVIG